MAQHRPEGTTKGRDGPTWAQAGPTQGQAGQHGPKMGRQQQQQQHTNYRITPLAGAGRCWWVSALLKGLFLMACCVFLIVLNQLSSINCHTNQLPPTNCHQPPTQTFSLLTCGVIRSYNSIYCEGTVEHCANDLHKHFADANDATTVDVHHQLIQNCLHLRAGFHM